MKKLVKVVAVALVLATLCMNASTVMAAPVNGASHASENSAFARFMGYFAAVWGAAVWGGNAAVWGRGGQLGTGSTSTASAVWH